MPGAPSRGKSSSARAGGGGVRTAAAEELSSKRLRRDELEAMLEEARGVAEARMHTHTEPRAASHQRAHKRADAQTDRARQGMRLG